jgi:hypothetical protein
MAADSPNAAFDFGREGDYQWMAARCGRRGAEGWLRRGSRCTSRWAPIQLRGWRVDGMCGGVALVSYARSGDPLNGVPRTEGQTSAQEDRNWLGYVDRFLSPPAGRGQRPDLKALVFTLPAVFLSVLAKLHFLSSKESRSITLPSTMRLEIRRAFQMLTVGSPSTTRMSARRPGTI